MKKIITTVLVLAMTVLAMTACNEEKKPAATQTPAPTEKTNTSATSENLYENTIAFTIEMEDGRVMKGELYPDVAPLSVKNFVKLANEKFYDGLVFHRVIPGFMIQGGGFDEEYNHKETEDTIKGEFSANGVKNDLKHTRGVLSMARTQIPDSASSQFFIMHVDYPSLDGQYAAFGRVTEGLEVIDEIANVETTVIPEMGMSDVPVNPQIIKTITIEE